MCRIWFTSWSAAQGPRGPRRAPSGGRSCRCQETVERAMPPTWQTRARPYGLPGEGAVAWLIVSPSCALKGGCLKPSNVLTSELNCHGRLAQLCAPAAKLTVTAIERLCFHRLWAGIKERLAPGCDTGGREPELT